LTERARQLVASLLVERADSVIAEATRVVIAAAPDLQGTRPIDETRQLVTALREAYWRYFDGHDFSALEAHVMHVIAFRAGMGFQLATPIHGYLSIVKALEPLVREAAASHDEALEATVLLRDAHIRVVLALADRYHKRLTDTVRAKVVERTAELERANRQLSAATQRAESDGRAKTRFAEIGRAHV
jgi:hypothetical protein